MKSEFIADLVDIIAEFVPWTINLNVIIKLKNAEGKKKYLNIAAFVFIVLTVSILCKINTLSLYTLNAFTITVNVLFMLGFGIYGIQEIVKQKKADKTANEHKTRKKVMANGIISMFIAVFIFDYICLVFTGFIGSSWKEKDGSFMSRINENLFIIVTPSEGNDASLSTYEKFYLEKGAEVSLREVDEKIDITQLEKSIKDFKEQKKQYEASDVFVVLVINFVNGSDKEMYIFILENNNSEEMQIRDNTYLMIL